MNQFRATAGSEGERWKRKVTEYFPTMAHYTGKLQGLPLHTWAIATAVGVFQMLTNDAFFWVMVILFFATMVDWLAGRWAIRATNAARFSRKKSREGLYSKALGLAVLILLRSMEAVLPILLHGNAPSTDGMLASIIAIALFVDELDSIDRHRQTLGRPPIPMLTWAIHRLRSITGAERRVITKRLPDDPKEGVTAAITEEGEEGDTP